MKDLDIIFNLLSSPKKKDLNLDQISVSGTVEINRLLDIYQRWYFLNFWNSGVQMLIYYNIALHYKKNKSREKAFILVIIKNEKYLDTDLFDAWFYCYKKTQRWKLRTVFEIICYFGINIILVERLLTSWLRFKHSYSK